MEHKIYYEQQDGCFVVKRADGTILVDELDEDSAKLITFRWNSHEPDGLVPKLAKVVKEFVNIKDELFDVILRGDLGSEKSCGLNLTLKTAEEALALYKNSGLAPEGQKGQEAPAALDTGERIEKNG